MAKLRGGDDGRRGPSLRGRVVVYGTGADRTVAAWPRSRPGNRSAYQLHGQELLRQANLAVKLTHALIQQSATDATRGTRFLARDLLFKAYYARLPAIILEDGTRLTSMPTRVDISELLNNLTWQPGSMLFRGTDFWLPVAPGLPGDVLRYSSSAETPVWGPPGQGTNVATTVARRTTDATTSNTWPRAVAYESTIVDDLGAWSISNPTRLTVPAGATRIRLGCGQRVIFAAAANRALIASISRNAGTSAVPVIDAYAPLLSGAFTTTACSVWSPWFPPGDSNYFEAFINLSPTVTAQARAGSWFAMEAA